MTNHAAGIGTCTQMTRQFRSILPRRCVCSKAKKPTLALQWIKEVEVAKSQDGKHFPDYKELDLMMAEALKRCYDKQTHVRKKISVEEQRAQKDNRFLRGRQIAYLVYEYFRPTIAFDEIQGLSGLFSIKMENDDIQDFDLRGSKHYY